MSVSKLIRHFEGLGKVPVDVNEVVAKVAEFLDSASERIRVHGVDKSFEELRATIYRYKEEDGTTYMMPIMVSEIVYSRRMPLPWQRFAVCKEALHILDPDPVCTTSMAGVLTLANDMAKDRLPRSNGRLETMVDQIAKYQALAVLLPYGFHEDARPLYEKGTLSAAQVADYLQIPEAYAEMGMSKLWPVLRQSFLAL